MLLLVQCWFFHNLFYFGPISTSSPRGSSAITQKLRILLEECLVDKSTEVRIMCKLLVSTSAVIKIQVIHIEEPVITCMYEI